MQVIIVDFLSKSCVKLDNLCLKIAFVFGDGENWFKQNECIALTVIPYKETTV